MKQKLSRNSLINCLTKSVKAIPDHRLGNNLIYSFSEAVSFAFSCFYLQQPSFLRHEKSLQKKIYRKNTKHLFPRQLSKAQTCRNILDIIDPVYFEPAFDKVFSLLDRSGILRELYISKECGLLLAGDGVDNFYSTTINCANCSVCRHSKDTEEEWPSYAHKIFTVNIVHPTKNIVLSLQPEFITPQDGNEKQDCERSAARRWMQKFRRTHHLVKATLLVDALHCNQSFFIDAIEHNFHITAVCKHGSNPFFLDWTEDARKGDDLCVVNEQVKKNGRFHTVQYEFLEKVPLRDSNDAIYATYISMIEIDEASGKKVRYEYATTHKITKENVRAHCLAARKRWKTENEGHNTLKNQGYRFSHNYGHGDEHLSSVLSTLILFVYLVHSTLELIGQDPLGRLLELDTRQECFALMRSLLRALIFTDWDMLYLAMLRSLDTS